MAVIIENSAGRRLIRLNTEDILDIVREYQRNTCGLESYDKIREILNKTEFYLPEEV